MFVNTWAGLQGCGRLRSKCPVIQCDTNHSLLFSLCRTWCLMNVHVCLHLVSFTPTSLIYSVHHYYHNTWVWCTYSMHHHHSMWGCGGGALPSYPHTQVYWKVNMYLTYYKEGSKKLFLCACNSFSNLATQHNKERWMLMIPSHVLIIIYIYNNKYMTGNH